MTSLATYRGYTHPSDEVNLVSVDFRTRYSPRMRKLTETRSLRIAGELQDTTSANIIQRANDVINAYSQDYGDFTFTVGGVLAHKLLNSSDCISGVKVKSKSFPSGDPDQLATTRTFSATLEGVYDICEDNLVQWTDSLSVVGNGGPVKTVVNTVFGPFQFYYAPSSAVLVTQSGSAIGFNSYPDPPPPIGNSDAEFNDRHTITQTSGVQQGTGIRFYHTRWSYQFVFSFIHDALPVSK